MGRPVLSKLNWNAQGSLRRKLTLQVAILAALGLAGITGWAAIQMRQMLIGSHQQTLDYVAERFSQDVEKYSAKSYSSQESLEKAVSLIPKEGIMLWVSDAQKKVVVRSEAAIADPMTLQRLSPQMQFPTRSALVRVQSQQPELNPVSSTNRTPSDSDPPNQQSSSLLSSPPSKQHRYLLVCGVYLNAAQASAFPSQPPQKLYLAYDVTQEYGQYMTTVKSLAGASILLLLLLTSAIAYSVKQATQPLTQISDLARQISATELGTTRLELEQVPAEIDGLVQTFNAMLLRLSESWNKQRQFVNDASHELRTPLAIVHGYLQSVLRRPQSLNPLQKEALTTASEETQRTIHMLQEMLAIARADNGQLEFELRSTLAQPILHEVAELTQEIHQRRVTLRLPSEPVSLWTDTKHLTQVLLNLVDNAVKYSEPSDTLELTLLPQTSTVTIEVTDSGIGIDPEHLDCVFERFYRADEARNRKGGTGLGLALVKTLVEGMGGQITVRSKLKEGSTFSIVLPRPPG